LGFYLTTGGEEGRPGWPSIDHARRRNSGPIVNSGNLSKQKSPVTNDLSLSKDATVCSALLLFMMACINQMQMPFYCR